jgi:hypothetical protein
MKAAHRGRYRRGHTRMARGADMGFASFQRIRPEVIVRNLERWTASIVFAASTIAASGAMAGTQWDKGYRDNFVSGCMKSNNTGIESAKMAQACACMAQEMERQMSEDRMVELSRMPEGQEKATALTPYLQTAKAKCDSRLK